MKKSILNLGQALNREEQKEVFGGFNVFYPEPLNSYPGLNSECYSNEDCDINYTCLPCGVCVELSKKQFLPC
jgi:hypothetical protein